ncbi:hypothetical protein CDAR_25851 [Caerostris darwini]|uniref:Uncharacterized protein n=1 Tax=Caerostris darwini TaxID=1538125 RepID=A0AAV4PJM3_9ARAC|nr:hypothetical protein CDAR_25851 [Caerostris darwini]
MGTLFFYIPEAIWNHRYPRSSYIPQSDPEPWVLCSSVLQKLSRLMGALFKIRQAIPNNGRQTGISIPKRRIRSEVDLCKQIKESKRMEIFAIRCSKAIILKSSESETQKQCGKRQGCGTACCRDSSGHQKNETNA